ARVVEFRTLESYSDTILDWLSAIGGGEPATAAASRIVASMDRAVRQLDRVQNSARHRNLSAFIRHALLAVQSSEWDGARYILLTAFAALSASALSEQKAATAALSRRVLQFPVAAVRGIVTG